MSGTVKAWIEEKGFGFVTPSSGGPDVFVHRNQLTDGQALLQGAQVTFECRYNPSRAKYEATSCSGASMGGAGVSAAATAVAPGGGFVAAGKGGGSGSQDNLFVAGLPMDMSEEKLRELFGLYGAVTQCKILPDQPMKTDRAALVRFGDEAQAKWMVDNMNGNIPVGMSAPLTVRFAGDRPGVVKGGPCFGKGGLLALADNRFAPYGIVAGLGAPPPGIAVPPPAALPAGVPAAMPAAALASAPAGGTQLSEASLAAALVQLMPALQGLPQPAACAAAPIAAPAPVGTAGALLSSLAALQPAVMQPAATQPWSFTQQPALAQPPALANAAGCGGLAAAVAAALPAALAPAAATPVAAAPVVAAPVAATVAAMPLAVNAGSAGQGAAPAAVPTAGVWLETTDPGSGKPYYYHSVTRETRWEKPAEMG